MDSSVSYNDSEDIDQQLLKSKDLELAYQEVCHNTHLIVKDEVARRVRVRVLLLENENDELHDQLGLGDDRIDALEGEGEELRVQLQLIQEEAYRYEAELKAQTREANSLRAEVISMNGVTIDSTKLLTEKLSLAREVSTLKPELEHLRAQVTHQQTILSEKLALQRQVSTLEVELENEKRSAKRVAKKNDYSEKEAEFQAQLDALQKDHTREKREIARAQSDMEAEFQSQIDTLQRDLAREKREAAKIVKEREKELKASEARCVSLESKLAHNDTEAEYQSQIDSFQRELAREKKEAANALKFHQKELKASDDRCADLESKVVQNDTGAEFQSQIDTLNSDLTRERKEAAKVAKEHEEELKASGIRYTILEMKVDQMRIKLRATKDELKESQIELSEARAAVAKLQAKRSRKRSALEMVADGNIGTPDGVAARGKRPALNRGRPDQTTLGEKSLFSITPFLNRTINMATDKTTASINFIGEEAEEEVEEFGSVPQNRKAKILEAITENPDISSPCAAPKSKGKKKKMEKATEKAAADGDKNILGEGKPNAKKSRPAPKKPKVISKLDKVVEEYDENEQRNSKEPVTEKPAGAIAKEKKAVTKPLKFQGNQMEAEETGPKKKRRKLVGGPLFDDDEGETTKRPAKSSMKAPRLLVKSGLAGPGGGSRGGLDAASGFGGFSPLKKDRRGVGASFLA